MVSPEYDNPVSPSDYDFGTVLDMLKEGNSMCRAGWNGDHVITLQNPTPESKMTKPYIYITTEQGDKIPWLASQSDMLATDWQLM